MIRHYIVFIAEKCLKINYKKVQKYFNILEILYMPVHFLAIYYLVV
jgi:hypothetical protein